MVERNETMGEVLSLQTALKGPNTSFNCHKIKAIYNCDLLIVN